MYNWFKKVDKATQNESNYRKWLNSYVSNTTATKIELERVFTDRENNNWYVFKNIGTMTRERAIKIEEVLTWIDYGISKEEFVSSMQGIKSEVENLAWENPTKDKLKKFHAATLQKIGDLLYRIENIKVEDLMLQAVMYFVLIDNENPYIINTQQQKEKYDIAKNDPELRAFFLQLMEHIFLGWNNTKNNNSQR